MIMNIEKQEQDDLDAMLKKAALELGEHFDSVQIVCSRKSGDTTTRFQASSGNIYACEGSVREWLKVQDLDLKRNHK
jgi:hypothetical protein